MALAALGAASAAAREAAARGKSLFDAAGCATCKTDKTGKGALLAGGRWLKTPFGVFYSPNITPDADTGIGSRSDDGLRTLLRMGMTPDGDFVGAGMAEVVEDTLSRLNDADVDAIIANLRSVRPLRQRMRRGPSQGGDAPPDR